jgi:uncharacterized membrane protein YeaQ/YmgE (transglycosylase-associated protein family)
MLVRADDPWSGVDDGAIEINQNRKHGGSCAKQGGTLFRDEQRKLTGRGPLNSVLSLLSTLDDPQVAIHIGGMSKKPRSGPGQTQARQKPTSTRGFRSPVRISIDHEALAALDKRAIAAQIGVGIVAGWLASWLVGGSGLLQYVVTGLAGSLIGGFLLERLGIDLGIRNRTANGVATATLGAVIVVLMARLVG